MAHLLVIDDDPALLLMQMRQAFPAHQHTIEVARTGGEALRRVRVQRPNAVLLDLCPPDASGMEAYYAIREIDPRIPVIFMTMAQNADAAIDAMQQGARDYLFKPLDLDELRRVIVEALDVGRRMHEPALATEAAPVSDVEGALTGTCPAMREVYKAIGLVAAQSVPVLINGESGTGKELVAQAIYHHGPRASAPFLALNCAAIPENLLESELFGHEKGAFTGADRRHIGKFEQCDGGTLFLDEIGDMPLALQAKLLRVLQGQVFERVGGSTTVRTDVRLIAATHRDLKALADVKGFRPDLYYRLNVFTINIPPLRDRGEDLVLLTRQVHPAVQPRAGTRSERDRTRSDGPAPLLLVARQCPRAAKRVKASDPSVKRRGAIVGVPVPRPPRSAPSRSVACANVPFTCPRDPGGGREPGHPTMSSSKQREPKTNGRYPGDQHAHTLAKDSCLRTRGSPTGTIAAARRLVQCKLIVPIAVSAPHGTQRRHDFES